jgi:hypothetical protein
MLKKEFLEDPAKEAAFSDAWKKTFSDEGDNKKNANKNKAKSKIKKSDVKNMDTIQIETRIFDPRNSEEDKVQTSPSAIKDAAGAYLLLNSDQKIIEVIEELSSTQETFKAEEKSDFDSCTISIPSAGKKEPRPTEEPVKIIMSQETKAKFDTMGQSAVTSDIGKIPGSSPNPLTMKMEAGFQTLKKKQKI